jgi:hypothetical protein
LTETELNGDADIVLEIVSSESIQRDYADKLHEYEKGTVNIGSWSRYKTNVSESRFSPHPKSLSHCYAGRGTYAACFPLRPKAQSPGALWEKGDRGMRGETNAQHS